MFPFDDNIPSIPSIPTLYTADSVGRRPANGPLPAYRRRNMLLRMIRSVARLSAVTAASCMFLDTRHVND